MEPTELPSEFSPPLLLPWPRGFVGTGFTGSLSPPCVVVLPWPVRCFFAVAHSLCRLALMPTPRLALTTRLALMPAASAACKGEWLGHLELGPIELERTEIAVHSHQAIADLYSESSGSPTSLN